MCPCGTRVKSRTHIVGECVVYKEERDVLEEMSKLEECDMEEFVVHQRVAKKQSLS